MDKTILKEIATEQAEALKKIDVGVRREAFAAIAKAALLPHTIVISGLRRCGKSTLLHQITRHFYQDEVYYFNFEDERLLKFSSDDFNSLLEVFAELFGERRVIVFDEIQNVSSWEIFIRRQQDRGYKFFISGSNASLLSREFGTKLTGRALVFELFPFSFREFLAWHGSDCRPPITTAVKRAAVKRYFNEYLQHGGMPEFLKYREPSLLKRVYDDILYRDIAARYDIKEVKALRELGLYLLTNISARFSCNNLKNILGLGSVNTVKNYIDHLENCFLLFTVNKFAYSLKEQLINNRKIYCVDNGLANAVAFRFSQDKGKYLENLIFMELKRQGKEIYYYKTRGGQEVDFLTRNGLKKGALIQVADNLNNEKTRRREIEALRTALTETGTSTGLILTDNTEEKIKMPGRKTIIIMPVYKWLLETEFI